VRLSSRATGSDRGREMRGARSTAPEGQDEGESERWEESESESKRERAESEHHAVSTPAM